jgi:cysteine-rich repeat protein
VRLAISSLALLTGCSIPEFVHPPGPPVIERFEVTPFEIGQGQITTVTWKVTGATSIVLHGAGDPRDVEAEGALPLMPERTTKLELVATGEGGTSRAIAEARIVALEEVQILRYEVTPSLVEPGDPVRVVWRTEHSTRVVVRISSGETLIDHAPAAGTIVFRPQRDVTVQLTAEGWPEPKIALATVRADPDGPSIHYFSALPASSPVGTDVGLMWVVANTERVRVLEATGTSSVVLYEESAATQTGFLMLVPEAGTHTYLLEASSTAGTVVESTTAFVLPRTPPEIVELTVTPTITGSGGDVIIRYSTRFADWVQVWANSSIVHIGDPGQVHMIRRVPNEILSIEVVAENLSAGLETREVRTVVVSPELPAIDALGSSPADFVDPGQTAVVSWRVRDAASVSLDTDVGDSLFASNVAEGTFDFEPQSDVNLRFTAQNARGRTTAYLPLRVLGRPVIDAFSSDTPVARQGRPVTFSWSTRLGENAIFSFETNEEVPLSGSLRQYTNFLGESQARLQVTNDRTVTSTIIGISVIEPASGMFETEPNDTEPFAGGPYFTFPGTITGEVAGSDVDLFELTPLLGDRISLDTTPPGGCAEGVRLEVYEIDRTIGLLGPRLVIDGPSLCASADPLTTPVLASLQPPIFVALRRPSGTSTITPSPYELEYSAQGGFCADGIVDLFEDCDDGNLVSNDGCTPGCDLEDLDEGEPNDAFPTEIPIETPVRAHLSHMDVDLFRFEITPADAGPRSILLEAPVAGSCSLDVELTLYDPFGVAIARDDNGGLGCPSLDGPGTILTQGVYELEVRPGVGRLLPRKGRYVFSVR